MIHMLAQQAVDLGGFDWKHVLLALAVPVAGYVGHWIGTRGVALVEDKLRAAGHPQAADAFDVLVKNFREVATDADKKELAQQAKDAGIDHPAIERATK